MTEKAEDDEREQLELQEQQNAMAELAALRQRIQVAEAKTTTGRAAANIVSNMISVGAI